MPDENGTLTYKYYWNGGTLSTNEVPSKYCHTLFKLITIGPSLGLSNEILCIFIAQESTELQKVKC